MVSLPVPAVVGTENTDNKLLYINKNIAVFTIYATGCNVSVLYCLKNIFYLKSIIIKALLK